MTWENELIGLLSAASMKPNAFGPRDAQLLTALATQVTAIVRLATLVEELELSSASLSDAQTETVLLLAAAAEAHDRTTGLHLRDIRAVTEALARELGRSDDNACALGLAAVLHDIGKIRVPDRILATTGQLSDGEWSVLKKHTTWGAEFLAGRPGFELATIIARCHHERWDGTGYPHGLTGDDIPEAAAIVAVADTFDAITSNRPYRAARDIDVAIREISDASGAQFSPAVVGALVRLYERGVLANLKPSATDEAA
jgi:putative two-component system response regulator